MPGPRCCSYERIHLRTPSQLHATFQSDGFGRASRVQRGARGAGPTPALLARCGADPAQVTPGAGQGRAGQGTAGHGTARHGTARHGRVG